MLPFTHYWQSWVAKCADQHTDIVPEQVQNLYVFMLQQVQSHNAGSIMPTMLLADVQVCPKVCEGVRGRLHRGGGIARG